MSAATGPQAPDHAVENRIAERLPASRLPSITGVRISPYSVGATLVNISATGLLIESDGRIKPGSDLKVLFEGTFEPKSTTGRVVRCSVAGIGPSGLRYHVGIAFAKQIPINDGVQAPAPIAAPPPPTAPRLVPSVLRNRW